MIWISVKDRLPDQEGKYLVYAGELLRPHIVIAWFIKDLYKFDKYDFPNKHRAGWVDYELDQGYAELTYVTHWMPLPAAPERSDREC
jgi:hypothetical protein